MFLAKLLPSSNRQRHEARKTELSRALIRKEAKIGGEIFGPVKAGGRREFFCLDEHTWVWHEEWTDAAGKLHIKTTRYDVRPDGILKAQDGQHYQQVSREEARNLRMAAQAYVARVKDEIYAPILNS